MKKLLAILLVMTMVLPLCVFTNAAEPNVEKKPFMISNSQNLDTDYDNFWPKVMIWSRASDEYVSEDHFKVDVAGLVTESPIEAAEQLKEKFDGYPDGMRYIRLFAMRPAFVHLLEDTIFMERGVKMLKAWMDELLHHYKKIGGKLDGVVADLEYFDGFAFYINREAQKTPLIYTNIVDNPNYATKIRPELEARGFPFWTNISDTTPEIFSINENSKAKEIWNVVIRNHYNRYVDEAVYDTLMELYPEAVYTDYQARVSYAWDKIPCESGGSHLFLGGNHVTVGNVNYFNTYAARPGTDFFADNGVPVYKHIDGFNGVAYGNDPFSMVLFESIFAKKLKASAPDGQLTPIIAWHNYSGRKESYCNTPYFTEMTYHLGMLDPHPFQSYIIKDEILARGSDVDEAVKVVSEQLDELTRVAGYADRKHISTPYTWNDKYVLTGMYAGGRNIWRITPDLINSGITLESFKVSGAKDLTFSIGGQTITFPGGKIIEDSKISIVGSCGYWVETAKDVLPVITSVENRYEQYPAFLENFDSYEVNDAFDFNMANPVGCWELKKAKSAVAKIVADGDNKSLAMSDSYILKLKTILKNVTAGDTYAENQAWEIEVDVPADLPADGEIYALNLYGGKSKALEGGFKIAGGKLYYDKNGAYEELTGVDVSKGGKFKLKRNVDFNNKDALKCDYIVCDASGKVLAEVKDVPMVTVELPVEKLSFGVENIGDKAVKFDNFKIYANGVAADLTLYDAYAGRQFTAEEMAKPYAKDTAYRLSWLNGTGYEKEYNVVAAYYNGETLVEEKVIETIKMAPGTDHVATGIVKVAEGQSVKIFTRDISKPEPQGDAPSQDTNPTEKPEKKDNGMLIAIIIVAVAIVAIIVVGVVFLTKKPAPKTEEKEKTEE